MKQKKYGGSSASTGNKTDTKKMESDFKQYADKSNKIHQEGMEKMGKTLGIDIYEDIFITYFFYRCGCKAFDEVSMEEYKKGLSSFDSNSLSDVKPHIISVKEELLNIFSDDFKQFYSFLFTFNMDKKSKTITCDIVELYFNELFGSQFKIVAAFLTFLKDEKGLPPLKSDQWLCFLDLLKTIGDSFPKGYSMEDSWPILFDDFYQWFCTKNGITIEKPEY